ncbi:cardiolipin synthase [Rubritalea squalenifaciens DSM 18772]|uniref:Cardiolipin synthase n=2 Tax=Rubritalea squalenifaciens TaxID=407226 RepID=A0A1M6NFT2_9BACT|nr:cardiolipin synthase [Rubritalea squalenifaciens DSM 18772]
MMLGMDEFTWLTGLGLFLAHLLGFVHIIHVLLNVRSSQGAIAWILALIVIPWAAIPFYWVAGRTRFDGYVRARRSDEGKLRNQANEMRQKLHEHSIPPIDAFGSAAEHLGGLPFTNGNRLELLINGEATFKAMFKAISSAQEYLLINFYIVKDDKVGKRFQEALIERARAGVRVYLIYDGFGSHSLPRRYVNKLENEGIQCHAFGTNNKWWSRLQINFRNHRKIVVIDGKTAFLGGINIGDEYLGEDPKFGHWRDTHIRITGPAVQAVQLVYLEDWNWAANEILDLNWSCTPHAANQECAIIPTGPSDFADSWQLIVAEAANSARHRLWITSPYFVPDGGVLTALKTAALRGVDVRILIPEKPDHLIVWLAAFSYQAESLPFGIKLYRYTAGFLHQKTMLIDERLACVGTANLDNRSFRLNFEISAFTSDAAFIRDVEEMLEKDFADARKIDHDELEDRPFHFKIASRAARLMAPIL